jgi:hypothetical protein
MSPTVISDRREYYLAVSTHSKHILFSTLANVVELIVDSAAVLQDQPAAG